MTVLDYRGDRPVRKSLMICSKVELTHLSELSTTVFAKGSRALSPYRCFVLNSILLSMILSAFCLTDRLILRARAYKRLTDIY